MVGGSSHEHEFKSKLIHYTAMTSTEMTSTAIDESPAHDCRRRVDALSRRGQSGPDKHMLVSPIESIAKRGKYHTPVNGSIQWAGMSLIGPYANSIYMSNSMAGIEPMASYDPLDTTNVEFAFSGANAQGIVFETYETMQPQSSNVENLNNAISAPNSNHYRNTPLWPSFTQTLSLVQIDGIPPVDLLVIHTILGTPIGALSHV